MNTIIEQLIKDKKNISGSGNVIKNNPEKEKNRLQKLKELNNKIECAYINQFKDDPIPTVATNLDMSYIKLKAKKEIKPRATFLGYFYYMSLTCQRKWCKAHGWSYDEKTPMAPTDENAMSSVLNIWRNIGDQTKLIVIGDAYEFNKIKPHLYKNNINRIEKNKHMIWMDKESPVPIVMESELHKQHPDYPNINNNTDWSKTK